MASGLSLVFAAGALFAGAVMLIADFFGSVTFFAAALLGSAFAIASLAEVFATVFLATTTSVGFFAVAPALADAELDPTFFAAGALVALPPVLGDFAEADSIFAGAIFPEAAPPGVGAALAATTLALADALLLSLVTLDRPEVGLGSAAGAVTFAEAGLALNALFAAGVLAAALVGAAAVLDKPANFLAADVALVAMDISLIR